MSTVTTTGTSTKRAPHFITQSSDRMKFANLVKEKEIGLGWEGLRDGDLDVLARVLQKSKVLQNLYLNWNQITLGDGKFADALANNRTLRVLDLYMNEIGAEGAKQLAGVLKANETLEEIYLYNNQIGDGGAKHLAGALMINKSLQMMDLDGNNIGNAGAHSLAASFVVNKSLHTIYLRCNKIGDKGAKAIVNAIKCNRTIAKLELEDNPTNLELKRNKISGTVQARILEIINDPNRKVPNDERSPLMQLETFIKNKDEEIKILETALASKDEVIGSLRADLASPPKFIEKVMAKKDSEIASLKSSLKYSKRVAIVDLNSELAEPTSKRPRTDDTS